MWPHLEHHNAQWNGGLTVCCVAAAHLFQAAMILSYKSAIGATVLLATLSFTSRFGDSSTLLAIVLTVVATLSIYGALFHHGLGRIWLFVPQQVVLLLMTGGVFYSAYQGHYLDGTAMPAPHILTDQVFVVTVLITHTDAILRRSAYG